MSVIFLFVIIGWCQAFYIDHNSGEQVDVEKLKHYTLYSYAASCRTGLTNWTCYWCNQRLKDTPPLQIVSTFFNKGFLGTYGFIGLTKFNEVLISFRGSESIDNWLTDFDFIKIQYPGAPIGAYVHNGFYVAYQAVKHLIHKQLLSLLSKNANLSISITGHSLGGALGVQCAIDLILSNIIPKDRLNIITFGQPRVGNKKFADFYNSLGFRNIRVTNKRDIVAHVPTQFMLFHHEKTEHWFPSNFSTFVKCDGSGEDPKCSNSIIAYSAYDHMTYLGFLSSDGWDFDCVHPPWSALDKIQKTGRDVIFNIEENFDGKMVLSSYSGKEVSIN